MGGARTEVPGSSCPRSLRFHRVISEHLGGPDKPPATYKTLFLLTVMGGHQP
jgi:hypothetical protein